MTQLDQFDAGVNAFRGKYDCLPGDCTSAQAPGGTSTVVPISGTQVGDGNIDYPATALATDESSLTWKQMQDAGVVGGSFVPAAGGTGYTGALPAAKAGGYVVLGGTGGTHYYMLGGVGTAAIVDFTAKISANTAAAIDKKRDDGLPFTGVVLAYGVVGGGTAAFSGNPFTTANAYAGGTAAAQDCSATGTAVGYKSGTDTALCLLRIRISG